jgi:hypothetical protein
VNSISNRVLRNVVGTDLIGTLGLGNSGNGIRITAGAHSNSIGDDSPDNANTISNNGGSGIEMDNDEEPAPITNRPSGAAFFTVDNRVQNNSIYGNTGKGIDLGASANDLHDFDEGPNRRQNFPVLQNYRIIAGQACVNVFVDSDPNASSYGANGLLLEFFVADPSGQGARSVGNGDSRWTEQDYAARAFKTVCVGDAAFLGLDPSSRLTATVTDDGGNTSQFALIPGAVTAAMVSLSGRVLDATGHPIRNAVVEIGSETRKLTVSTNSFGAFRFDRVESGQVYLLTTKRRGYDFGQPRLLSVVDQMTDIEVIASP